MRYTTMDLTHWDGCLILLGGHYTKLSDLLLRSLHRTATREYAHRGKKQPVHDRDPEHRPRPHDSHASDRQHVGFVRGSACLRYLVAFALLDLDALPARHR